MARPRSKANGALPEYMDVRHGKRTTTYYALIQGKRINLGHDRQAADVKLRELINGSPTAGTIADMCGQFIAYQRMVLEAGKAELAESTIDEYENSLNKYVLPVFGGMPPSSFQPTHSAQYLFAQRAKGRAVRANREMAALGSAFNFGMSKGMVAANPCHGVKRNKETPRSRRPETREVNALTQVAKAKGESAYMIILIGLMVAITGRRRAEVMRLTSFALRDDGIHVVDCKTKAGQPERTYLVSWSPLLRELVQEALNMKRSKASGYIFATLDGQPYTDSGFKTMWNRVMHDYAKAGGVWFTTHDLRAYYVTEKGEKGENPETHKNPATTKRVYDRTRVVKVKPLG
jgi:integrase